jgi:hypothetical protein
MEAVIGENRFSACARFGARVQANWVRSRTSCALGGCEHREGVAAAAVGVFLDARDAAVRIQGDEQARGHLDRRAVRELAAQDVPLGVAVWQRVAADVLVADVDQVARPPAECPQVVVDALLCAAARA